MPLGTRALHRLVSIQAPGQVVSSSPQRNVVPAEGVEPTRPYGHQILSLARLPIPPRRPTVCRLGRMAASSVGPSVAPKTSHPQFRHARAWGDSYTKPGGIRKHPVSPISCSYAGLTAS